MRATSAAGSPAVAFCQSITRGPPGAQITFSGCRSPWQRRSPPGNRASAARAVPPHRARGPRALHLQAQRLALVGEACAFARVDGVLQPRQVPELRQGGERSPSTGVQHRAAVQAFEQDAGPSVAFQDRHRSRNGQPERVGQAGGPELGDDGRGATGRPVQLQHVVPVVAEDLGTATETDQAVQGQRGA